ncbi:MAG: hypothetical protein PQJ59_09845 [Spirochaetales bacterium]|nr:hypothetical protein [Spirochaetales bacterium]
MKKILFLLLLVFIGAILTAQGLELKAGPAYKYYGISADTGVVELGLGYHSIGLDVGAVYAFTSQWELGGDFFWGVPVFGNGSMSDGSEEVLDLSTYDFYRYFLHFSVGPSYRWEKDDWTLSLGPFLASDNLVLVTSEDDPSYILSYTLGLGMGSSFRYYWEHWGCYADLKGSWNFAEILIEHDDFENAWGGELSLGLIWRMN